MREVCCTLKFVLLYSELNELTTIYCYKTVSIRVYQIEPDPYISLQTDSSTSKSILLKTFYQQEQGKINF
jgi:hypothetical protein